MTRKNRVREIAAWLSVGLALALLGSASASSAQSPEARAAEAANAQSAQAVAAEHLDTLRRSSGVPGISVAIATPDRLLFSSGAGYADLEHLAPATATTVYNVGSISKVMAAVAVMQLVEQGKVGLDDEIQRYVPGFPEKRAPVTLQHLMTHTSGIRHYRPFDFPRGLEWANVASYDSIAEAIAPFAEDPLLFEPGEYYSYTSYGVNLLQGVVETASGSPFEEYMRREVWGPAGMLATSFDVPERIVLGRARSYDLVEGRTLRHYPDENVTYKFAGGGMLSTAEDLVRFAMALLRGRLLRPETVERMLTPQLGEDVTHFEDGSDPTPLRWKQALMWRIRLDEQGREYVNHCGSVKGFNGCLIFHAQNPVIVALVENGSGAAVSLREALAFAALFRNPEEPAR